VSNLKWNRQTGTGTDSRVADNSFATKAAATEAELEAFRYRGTPFRKSVPPAAITKLTPAKAAAPVAKALPVQTNLTSAAPVASPASPAGEDIRDFRQPGHPPTPWVRAVIAAGVISFLAALWKWIRLDHLFVMLPHERALQYLEESRALMNPDRAREYSHEVSNILRHYLEQRFSVHAPQLTTEKFLHALMEARETMSASQRALLGDFLQHCDQAKSAGGHCCLPDLEALRTSAVEFVRQTASTKTDKKNRPLPTVANNAAPAPEFARSKTI